MTGKTFDAWYLDSAFTNKAPDAIADYIKANPNEEELTLYAKYKALPIMPTSPMLTTGKNFNAAIKTLAAGVAKKYDDGDDQVLAVQIVDALPSGKSTNTEIEAAISSGTMKDVSKDSDRSYLVWWDADTSTIKLYSKSGSIVLNSDSSSMFSDCSSLTTLNVSSWDTSWVTNMNSMFPGCSSLTTLDVSNWDTSKVTNMSGMFSGSGLTTLDVSNWDTSKVTNMSGMFAFCPSLATLDVSGWNTSSIVDMSGMFAFCSSLEHIYIGSGWNTDKVYQSFSMFASCLKLPNYNSSVVDKTNAHAGSGGYMTLKS